MFSDEEGEGEVSGQASAQQLSRLSFSSTISGLLDSVFRYSTIIQYNTVNNSTVQYSDGHRPQETEGVCCRGPGAGGRGRD